MSQTLPTPSASSKLRTIFVASLKEYEKTKADLLTRPFMAKSRTCNSPTDILAVIRTQIQQFGQFTSGNNKLTRWLNTTMNVLDAFS